MIKGSGCSDREEDPASKRETGEHRDAVGGGRHTIETDDCGDSVPTPPQQAPCPVFT